MSCLRPYTVYRVKTGPQDNGKWPITFNKNMGISDDPLQIPCGLCSACLLDRSRMWSVRCMHEASLWSKNCFVTLTFAPEHLPGDGNVSVRDVQLFLKRLRKRFGSGIRFFACGEYGDKYRRPHYHLILFNHDFPDKVPFSYRMGNVTYISPILQELWPYGHSMIGSVTQESCAYVARYILKKQLGKGAKDYYSGLGTTPEFITMSRRPGIAHDWFQMYHDDIYNYDKVVYKNSKGKTMFSRPPRYYDDQYSRINTTDFDIIKHNRYLKSLNFKKVRDDERNLQLLCVKDLQINKLVRGYESDAEN